MLNALFTIGRRRRYTAVMLFLALLAATAPAEAAPRRLPEVAEQARASVRIVSGAWVTAQEIPREAMVRETRVEAADGSVSAARLVEFP